MNVTRVKQAASSLIFFLLLKFIKKLLYIIMKEYNNCLKATAIGDFCGSAFARVFRSKIYKDELFDDALLHFKEVR